MKVDPTILEAAQNLHDELVHFFKDESGSQCGACGRIGIPGRPVHYRGCKLYALMNALNLFAVDTVPVRKKQE